MKAIIICGIILLTFSNPGYAIKLGDALPKGSRPTGEGLLISSSQISDSYEVVEKSIKFIVTLNENNKINFISPSSESFITPEGIHVGSTYDDVWSVTVTKASMQSEPGWGHFIRLPSGWIAGFCIGDACDDYPNLQDKVGWLFKRERLFKRQ